MVLQDVIKPENRLWLHKGGVVMPTEDVVLCLYEISCEEMGLKCQQTAIKEDWKTTLSGARKQQGQLSPAQSSVWEIIKKSLRN